jgi:enamine deaminase RidA (YjgF/YER057c/UK114 family)
MLTKYLIFLPKVQGNFEEEWRQCLEQICDIKEKGLRLVKMNIFTDMPDYETYINESREIGRSVFAAFGDFCPAFNITSHPPEKPWKVVVEAGYIDINSTEIISKIWNSIPYVVCLSDTGKEVWAGGLGFGYFHEDTGRAAGAAYDQMRALLDFEDMSFDNLVRQWNYIGNILEIRNDYQNYQIYNEIRNENYQKYRHLPGYPAATGVGMKHVGVLLDFYAVKPGKFTEILPVNNPDQIKPYIYGQQVLKGIPSDRTKANQPPQFERAILVSCDNGTTLFISGTASIIGQDTVGIGDVEQQTIITLKNIARLTDTASLRHYIWKPDIGEGSLILMRVYVKKQDDFVKVKSICNNFHPGVPVILIEADICRDNLLVEIEAEFSIKDQT